MGVITRIRRPFHRDDDRYFRTRNLQLAVILFAQGFELVNLEYGSQRVSQFVFRNSYDLAETVERFRAKGAIFVEAQKLFLSWRTLRSKLGHKSY